MIHVAILLDKENDWLKKHLLNFNLKNKKYIFKFFYNYKKIQSYDIVFVLGYTKILPKKFIKCNKNILLVHESDLPKGKGFAPIQWQIIEGKKEITCSLIDLSEELDSGDIHRKIKFKLDGSELYNEIRIKQAKATLKLINEFLKSYPKINKTKQKGISTFFRRRKLTDGKLNINKSIKDQFNLLRVGNNEKWPSYFIKNKIKYIIKIYKEN